MKILSVIILFSISIYAQTDTLKTIKYQNVVLKTGESYEGYILDEDSLNIKLKTIDSIEVKIPKRLINRLQDIKGEKIDSVFYKHDKNDYHLYFAQTGKSIGAGNVSFGISEIFFPFVTVGITDFASISGGISLFPSFSDQLFYIAPKLNYTINNFSFSANAIYFNSFSNDNGGSGLAYLSSTFDQKKYSITVGYGSGFEENEFTKFNFLIVGFEFKAGTSSKFISENWFSGSDTPSFISFGFRTFSSTLSWDFGFITPIYDDIGFFIPWVGVTYNFR
ncbi:MAG: hypothetical protein K8F60_12585 [Melioribacteraceae bacterium]|nr:hypothetical protein [Melioribacteraceae bacterium]